MNDLLLASAEAAPDATSWQDVAIYFGSIAGSAFFLWLWLGRD